MTIANRRWSIPFLVWIAIGTIIPLLSIVYYGLTSRTGGLTFQNITAILEHDNLQALGLSLGLSVLSTLICLIIAFPMAMILANSKYGKQGFLIFVFILPMWMNFLLRTMAWQVLLERNGVINALLTTFGLPRQELMNTPGAVVLGMVYDFLPFMILPIYNAVVKIDKHLVEAARDLGAGKLKVYTKVVLPLTVPGIVSGITMVFIPALTTFAISNMLGGGKINLIGNIIEQEFTVNTNWYLGSGMSLVMMVFIIASMLLLNKFDKTGGASLL
ncbi:MAG: ABC transporter permease [Firmicutes bacterium]|nr:ABC transporter permease [Bacillota bacterium]